MENDRFAFLNPLWGFRDNVGLRCSLRLIGKRVVDFLSVLIELFSLGVMAAMLRANIDSKSAIPLQRRWVDTKFQVEGVAPNQPFIYSEN